MKQLIFLLSLLSSAFHLKAQVTNCVLQPPVIKINFGTGDIADLNTNVPYNYERISGTCPGDGYYTYTDYTSDCFNGTWFTITEDHTPGDVSGNMLLVNSSYEKGSFFSTTLNGLKGNTIYEFGVWLMNVFNSNNNCPFLLLPNITIRLQTASGKIVAQLGTGELARHEAPHWTQYRATFTTPPSETSLKLIMVNNKPGGCGNDFALDDITLRECKPIIVATTAPKKTVVQKSQTPAAKSEVKKPTPLPTKTQAPTPEVVKAKKDSVVHSAPVLKKRESVFPAPPPILTTRTNTLVKQIDTEAGDIRIDLYDNGEIDGDTVSVYHNNVLLKANARLTQKPTTMHIVVDADHPHHELIMVAENLGSIPPNTSLMIITAGTKRYQVFISSNEQKNAKVVLYLKE